MVLTRDCADEARGEGDTALYFDAAARDQAALPPWAVPIEFRTGERVLSIRHPGDANLGNVSRATRVLQSDPSVELDF